MGHGTIKQIVVITDGHANEGCSPAASARLAAAAGVTVSAIGILDGGHLGARGRREIEGIAAAGGGVANRVTIPDLTKTLQAVTWQATQSTLNMIINRELKKITGLSCTELSPEKRAGILDLMADLADQAELQMVLLLDTSASMTGKMPALTQSVQDLLLTLRERRGPTYASVARFPGRRQLLEVISKSSAEVSGWDRVSPAGRTPTGPAILAAVEMLAGKSAVLPNISRKPALDLLK